jgi:hypothetical protein
METETVRVSGSSSQGLLAGPPVKVSWGAIFGGTVAALAIGTMLYALGLAMGLSMVDPNQPGSVRGSSLFTGVWSLIVPLIALFIGGMVASRSSGAMTKVGGAIHGLVMWGLTVIAGAWMVTNLLTSVVGGVASVGKTAVQAGSGAVAGMAGQAAGASQLAESFGLNADDALRPLNQRLQAEGKPPVTSAQLQEAAKDVVQGAVREGRFDRELLISNLTRNSALTRTDAEELATRVEGQISDARSKLATAAQSVGTGALKAADATGKVFWGVFGALLLGMISALVGATLGVSKRQQAWARGTGEPQGPVITPPRREVYP